MGMRGDSAVPVGRRITDFLGFTDSPRTHAKILAKSTPMELLIRAVVLTVCVVLFTVSIFVSPGRGFVWFLLADLCLAYPAAIMWVRWRRYRKIWPQPTESSVR
ncbi:conserved hypothetical protein [Arthrobacter sp. 8AJ]|nr:conserved hypothetical protein [Arthrobacter sp. 8AJ]